MLILGIDPGANTGVAHFVDGELARLKYCPHQIERTLREAPPARVVLRIHACSRTPGHAARAGRPAQARNVGQVDAWCTLITSICGELGIPAHGISPAGKGPSCRLIASPSSRGGLVRPAEAHPGRGHGGLAVPACCGS